MENKLREKIHNNMLELLLYNLNPHSALGKGLLGDNILNTVKKNNEKLKTVV